MRDAMSRISSKYQTVIPKAVRERLELKTGDVLRFRVSRTGVTIDKVKVKEDDPFASFDEWTSAEDDRIYRDL